MDVNDLTIVLTNFGNSGMVWSQGDFNGDGKVDVNDLTILLTAFGATFSTGIAPVPEPSSLLLFGAGAVGLAASVLRRRAAR